MSTYTTFRNHPVFAALSDEAVRTIALEAETGTARYRAQFAHGTVQPGDADSYEVVDTLDGSIVNMFCSTLVEAEYHAHVRNVIARLTAEEGK